MFSPPNKKQVDVANYKTRSGRDFSNDTTDEAEALRIGVEEFLGFALLEPAATVLERAKKDGVASVETKILGDDDPCEVVTVWYEDDGKNYGFGVGETLSEIYNEDKVWIEF